MVLLSRQFQITTNYSVHTSTKTPYFNYYFTVIIPFRKPPYFTNLTFFIPPIFKITGFNLTKERTANSYDQLRLQSSTFQSNIGVSSDTGERTKYLCAFPGRSHKAGSHFT